VCIVRVQGVGCGIRCVVEYARLQCFRCRCLLVSVMLMIRFVEDASSSRCIFCDGREACALVDSSVVVRGLGYNL